MTALDVYRKLIGKCQQKISNLSYRTPLLLQNAEPLVSFTFDDFPRNALHTGGKILKENGACGTYYASFGLMGQSDSPVGEIFELEDIGNLLADGHELGCHTYAHCHAWDTRPRVFEQSIEENERVLHKHFPGVAFRTLSYPKFCPRPGTKRRARGHFEGCRGGGQTFNAGVTDRYFLRGYFLEQARGDLEAVKTKLAENASAGGWLIFATHDVSPNPTRFGCTDSFFREAVAAAIASGARILPVREALEEVAQARFSK